MKTKGVIDERGLTSYNLKTYRGLTHSVSQEEINDVFQFLSSILPHDESFVIPLRDPSTMSVKELKQAVQAAGLGARAAGFCEKAEYVNLLTEYNRQTSGSV